MKLRLRPLLYSTSYSDLCARHNFYNYVWTSLPASLLLGSERWNACKGEVFLPQLLPCWTAVWVAVHSTAKNLSGMPVWGVDMVFVFWTLWSYDDFCLFFPGFILLQILHCSPSPCTTLNTSQPPINILAINHSSSSKWLSVSCHVSERVTWICPSLGLNNKMP